MREKLSKIDVKDLKLERLSVHHQDVLETFETDEKELEDFLLEDALRDQKMHVSETLMCFYKPKNELVAFITLLTDAIGIRGTHLGTFFYKKGIKYSTLPSLKVGRLCVKKSYMYRGVGKTLMLVAMFKALNISKHAGCRYLIVDAKLNTNSHRFYKKLGFSMLKKEEKGKTMPMYYDMVNIYNDIYKEDNLLT